MGNGIKPELLPRHPSVLYQLFWYQVSFRRHSCVPTIQLARMSQFLLGATHDAEQTASSFTGRREKSEGLSALLPCTRSAYKIATTAVRRLLRFVLEIHDICSLTWKLVLSSPIHRKIFPRNLLRAQKYKHCTPKHTTHLKCDSKVCSGTSSIASSSLSRYK